MNFSKLFYVFLIICLGAQMPLQATGFKSKAIVALAAAAGAHLANGFNAMIDSIKNDKLSEARSTIFDLEKENRNLAATVNYTKDRLEALNPTTMLIMGAVMGASLVAYFALIFYEQNQKNASASNPAGITDKEELIVQA